MTTEELLKKFMDGYLGMEHHGAPMKSTPSNMSLEQCVECLATGHPFTVVLEPGDMTRYVVTFLPLDGAGFQHHGFNAAELMDCWLVTRTVAGSFLGVVANTSWDFAHHNLGELAGGNEHTGNVFVLFLSQLFGCVREKQNAPTLMVVEGDQ